MSWLGIIVGAIAVGAVVGAVFIDWRLGGPHGLSNGEKMEALGRAVKYARRNG